MANSSFKTENARVYGQSLAHAKAFYLKAYLEGNPIDAVGEHVGDRLTQHSTGVKDGGNGFVEFITDYVNEHPNRHVEIVRAWEDEQYVFLHVYHDLGKGEHEFVSTEFFETDINGRVVEHWSVTGAFEGKNPSGRTQTDGATELKDLDRTAQNKITVETMLKESVFPGAQPEKIERFFGEQYLQHNPNIGDGLDIVRQLSQAANPQLVYSEIVLCVGRGNFVAVLCKAAWEGAPLAQVDILRLENGKIVEHWDLNEPVPSSDVNSGKF